MIVGERVGAVEVLSHGRFFTCYVWRTACRRLDGLGFLHSRQVRSSNLVLGSSELISTRVPPREPFGIAASDRTPDCC